VTRRPDSPLPTGVLKLGSFFKQRECLLEFRVCKSEELILPWRTNENSGKTGVVNCVDLDAVKASVGKKLGQPGLILTRMLTGMGR
jgi:hypothetical protein